MMNMHNAEPASSVRCPLHGPAYYFAYNDLVHGTCPQALSYAQPCAGHSKYQLRFNHCVPGATFNNRGRCTVLMPLCVHRSYTGSKTLEEYSLN